MRVRADKQACIGAGQCVVALPEVFDQDEDGLVEVLQRETRPEDDDDVRYAARLCPARAIALDTTAPSAAGR